MHLTVFLNSTSTFMLAFRIQQGQCYLPYCRPTFTTSEANQSDPTLAISPTAVESAKVKPSQFAGSNALPWLMLTFTIQSLPFKK
jgi:hypothetical protein